MHRQLYHEPSYQELGAYQPGRRHLALWKGVGEDTVRPVPADVRRDAGTCLLTLAPNALQDCSYDCVCEKSTYKTASEY